MRIERKITLRDDKSIDMYFNDINKFAVLTPDEEVELFKRYKETKDFKAREKLLNHNLRFVVSVAKNYQINTAKIALNDLISIGNYGLIKAVEKFDYTKGFKFISYAVWWIQQTILEHMDKHTHQIRVASNAIAICRKIIKLKEKLYTETERDYEINDLYEMGLVKEEEVTMFKKYNSAIYPTSLNSFVTDDENLQLSDTIADETFDINTQIFSTEQNRYIIDKLITISKLKSNEKDIINSFFGLNQNESSTIYQLGHKYNMSAERIRQIKLKALFKMMKKSKKMEWATNVF
jgi:RNA polymerase primary sigma factor